MADEGRLRPRVLDEALLRLLARRLSSLTVVDTVSVVPGGKPNSVIGRLDRQYYPEEIERVFLELRAYTNGDFHVSYVEEYLGDVRSCRWDRHDQDHSTRDHYHPFPAAATSRTENRDFPVDVTTALETVVLPWVDDRLGRVWDETH